VIDAPGGGGKIPLLPHYLLGREGDDVLLRNYAGQVFRYPDPLSPGPSQAPAGDSQALVWASHPPSSNPTLHAIDWEV